MTLYMMRIDIQRIMYEIVGGGAGRGPLVPPPTFLLHYIEKMIVRKGASMVSIIMLAFPRLLIVHFSYGSTIYYDLAQLCGCFRTIFFCLVCRLP